MSQGNDFWYWFTLFFAFCGILFLAWLTTRVVGRSAGGRMHSRSMKVLETLNLGVEKSLLIIQIGEDRHLFQSSRGRLEHVMALPAATENDMPETESIFDFKKILQRYSGLSERNDAHTENAGDVSGPDAPPDPIQKNAERLRRLRRDRS